MGEKSDRPLISVIVPVYNVENYIRRCLDSLLSQTYENLEILLVDDGSMDESGVICDEYAKTDHRITVFHQKNSGQAVARNKGLDHATGKWISFIDSDDFICTEFMERMLDTAYCHEADIVHCRWQMGEADHIDVPDKGAVTVYSGIECYTNYFTPKKLPALESASNKIYRVELFDDLRFIPGRLLEDQAIMHHLFRRADRVAYLNEKLYYYFKSSGSTMRGKFTVNKLSALLSYEERLDFFMEIGGKELWGRALQQYEATLFKYYYWTKRDCSGHPEEIAELLKKICDTYLLLKEQKNVSRLVKICAFTGTKLPYVVGFLCDKLVTVRFWRR